MRNARNWIAGWIRIAWLSARSDIWLLAGLILALFFLLEFLVAATGAR